MTIKACDAGGSTAGQKNCARNVGLWGRALAAEQSVRQMRTSTNPRDFADAAGTGKWGYL
jgi:Flp pilus assembly protein TadD